MSFFGVPTVVDSMPAPQTFNAIASSTEMIAENTNRKGLYILNISNKNIFLGFGNTAEDAKGIRLVKDEILFFQGSIITTQAINVIAASGTGNTLLYQEFE